MASCGCKAAIVTTTLGAVTGAVVAVALGLSAAVIGAGCLIGGSIGAMTGLTIIAAEQIFVERHEDSFEHNTDYVALQGLDSTQTDKSWGILRQVSDLGSCD